MVAMGLCGQCSTTFDLFGTVVEHEPTHCRGSADMPAPKGVLGGWMCSCPCRHQPSVLYEMAQRQHAGDSAARDARYIELMREAGHIVKREPGDDSPLFACGYQPKRGD